MLDRIIPNKQESQENQFFFVYAHLVAGDTPNHALWEETQCGQLEQSQWLAEALERLVPSVPVFPCLGNHGNTMRINVA